MGDRHAAADRVDGDGRTARGLALLTGEGARDLLGAALAPAGASLVSHRPRQVAHQPGGPVTVSYTARVRWAGGGVGDEVLVATTARVREGALVLEDGDDRVAVWLHPFDPDLPGLARAHDERAVAALLDDLGLGGGPVRLRSRAYRPRRRAVVEAVGPRGRVFVKAVRPSRVEALHTRHRLLRAAGVPVPPSLGWTADGLLVLQALPGETLRHALRSRGAAVPSGADLLALLRRLPDELLDGPARTSWLDRAGHYAGVVGAALPDEAGRAAALAGTLAEEAEALAPAPVHGDFYEAQLLVAGGAVTGVLDVDTAGAGDPLDDPACLLGHLSVLAQADRAHAPATRRVADAYLAAFDEALPPRQLRLRVAAVVLSLATGPHRVQERGWPATTARRLDLAERWLADARAAGDRPAAAPVPSMAGLSSAAQGPLMAGADGGGRRSGDAAPAPEEP